MSHLEMDFHSLSRRELQALCKRNKIPANLTNIAMADALQSLPEVEGIDELNNPEKSIPGTPELHSAASRTATRSRRAPRPITEGENKDVNLPDTPAVLTTRRRAPATSTRNKSEVDAVMVTPAVPSSRRRAPAASGKGKMGAQEDGKSVQKVYGTRQSMRLLEKTMGGLSLTGKRSFESEKLENDVDENKPDSGEGSETTRDSELYRNLDQSLENETEVNHGLQEEKNKNSEYEVGVEASSQNLESATQKSDNQDSLSGIDGEDVDSGNDTVESVFQADSSEKANVIHGVIVENGSDVLNSVESGKEKDFSIDQLLSAVKSDEDSSAIAIEVEQTSIEKTQDEVSAEIMDNILPVQTLTPSETSEVSFVDALLPKPCENPVASSEDEEYENSSDDVENDESESIGESEVEEYENSSDDVENDESESIGESEDILVEVNVTEKEESENVVSDENLIDVQVTEAVVDLPSTLSKTPTSTKKMTPYQPLVAGETVKSPFAADTLQGQFPRPSGLTPKKNTPAKTQIAIEMMMSQASSVNKENIDSSGMKVEARKDDTKSTTEQSIRQLKKMLKQKLSLSSKNDHQEIVKKQEGGKARPALQRVPENGMVAAEEAN